MGRQKKVKVSPQPGLLPESLVRVRKNQNFNVPNDLTEIVDGEFDWLHEIDPECKRILTIDPGLNFIGVAIKVSETLTLTGNIFPSTYLSSGLRKGKANNVPKVQGTRRLVFIRESIRNLLTLVKPEYVAYESAALSFGPTRGKVFSMGEAYGLVKSELQHYMNQTGALGRGFTPTALKKICSGDGKASKDKVCESLYTLFQVQYDFKVEDDEADALVMLKALDQWVRGFSKMATLPSNILELKQ